MKYYYTDKQYKELLSNMVILATTNEQVNNHITEYFDKKKIMYQNKSLKTGDYCFKLKENPEQGRFLEQYFTEELFIERKNSLSELASSIKDNAFHNELKRAKLIKYKFLLVEQECGWGDIISHNYQNQYDNKAFWSTLHTFMIKYDLKILFCKKEEMGAMIYSICKSVLENEILK